MTSDADVNEQTNVIFVPDVAALEIRDIFVNNITYTGDSSNNFARLT